MEVDKINLTAACETPVWLMVWASEPAREIDVRMTYDDLKFITEVYATEENKRE